MDKQWTGCGTALVTPFSDTGALDEAAVSRLARRQVEAGVHFLVPCGTTGESPTLSRQEKLRVVELVASEANDRIPVLAGAGGYDTAAVVTLAQDMVRAGANGILSVTPYYNKPTPEGLYRHYASIANSIDRSVVVYNVPSRTGCNIGSETLARLATIGNVVGVKEASGDLAQMCAICQGVPDGFSVLSGDDAFTLPFIALGGVGVISVISNEVPKKMAEMVNAACRGDFAHALTLHQRLLPLMQVNFVESNPIPVKAALVEMGVLPEAHYRLPLVPPQPASQQRITDVLRGLGLQRSELRQASGS